MPFAAAVNVGAVRLMLDIAIRSGVERIVHLSSVGVVGATGHRWVTEETPCRPKSEYERTKLLERVRRGRRHAARSGSVSALTAAPLRFM